MKPNDDKKSIVSNYLTLHHCAVKLHELPSPPTCACFVSSFLHEKKGSYKKVSYLKKGYHHESNLNIL